MHMEEQILRLLLFPVWDDTYMSQCLTNFLLKLYELDHKESWLR